MAGEIKAVLFDLDNTLVDRVAAFRSLIAALWRDEPRLQESSTIDETVELFEEWDADGLTSPKRLIFNRAIKRWGKLSRNSRELESWYYANYARHFVPDHRVQSLVNTLQSHEIPWAIITNGKPFQVDVARAVGLYSRSSGIIVSSMFGASKPDPLIFAEGLRLVGISDPSDCLFVGDNPVADIKGALECGMRTAWVRRGRKWPEHLPHPILVVDHVSELAPLFGM